MNQMSKSHNTPPRDGMQPAAWGKKPCDLVRCRGTHATLAANFKVRQSKTKSGEPSSMFGSSRPQRCWRNGPRAPGVACTGVPFEECHYTPALPATRPWRQNPFHHAGSRWDPMNAAEIRTPYSDSFGGMTHQNQSASHLNPGAGSSAMHYRPNFQIDS